MSKLSTLKKLWKKDKRQILIAIYNNVVHTKITNILPDELYLKLTYWIRNGKMLNLSHPVTFCEKIQWLKLNDRNERYIELVDKVRVKSIVSKIIGEEYIIKTLGVWENVDDIDFSSLPNQFVLKCNHDSGSVVICKDKDRFDISNAKKKLSHGLKTDAFFWGREWPYKKVPRQIIAEEYLHEEELDEIRDYKFFCFNGKPTYCQVISNRSVHEEIDFFDMEWKHQPFVGLTALVKNSNSSIQKPYNFLKMKEFATVLAKDTSFSRIDFYEVSRRLYFGEITFYPASGFGTFTPDSWNYKLGEMVRLPIDTE